MSKKIAPFAGILFLVSAFLPAACGEATIDEGYTEFDAFALEIADALASQDLERLVSHTARTTVVCDEGLVEEVRGCQGLPVGATTDTFDVKFFGRNERMLLDSQGIRELLEGMLYGGDLGAPPDEIGGGGLSLYSTLIPDPLVWFPEDDENLPLRGDLAITYIGTSPREDEGVQRRLWVALAEQGGGGWRIRLWLIGYFRPDHPALNPSEENGFKRWSPP